MADYVRISIRIIKSPIESEQQLRDEEHHGAEAGF